jgi:exodeoxyribonuclease VII small subunit
MNDSPGEQRLLDNGDRTANSMASFLSASDQGWSYELTVAEVEAIINRIETGELELAEVFQQFAIAVKQLHQCEEFLTHQRHQVDLLIETLTDEPEDF